MSRTTPQKPLGDCPRCGAAVPSRHLLIRYERDDGSALYATCPDCETPVRPS
ncbi:MAG: hypothetical protein ABEJ94_03160 [Halorientalis sp.]